MHNWLHSQVNKKCSCCNSCVKWVITFLSSAAVGQLRDWDWINTTLLYRCPFLLLHDSVKALKASTDFCFSIASASPALTMFDARTLLKCWQSQLLSEDEFAVPRKPAKCHGVEQEEFKSEGLKAHCWWQQITCCLNSCSTPHPAPGLKANLTGPLMCFYSHLQVRFLATAPLNLRALYLLQTCILRALAFGFECWAPQPVNAITAQPQQRNSIAQQIWVHLHLQYSISQHYTDMQLFNSFYLFTQHHMEIFFSRSI